MNTNETSLLVVSPSATSPGVRSLVHASTRTGIPVRIVLFDDDNLIASIESASRVIYRVGPKSYPLAQALAAKLHGAKSEELHSFLVAFDKIQSYDILSKAGIAMPVSSIIKKDDMIDDVQLPMVLKAPNGNQGNGVELIESYQDLIACTHKLFEKNAQLLVQEYIKESHGKDKRIIVAGDRVIGAMTRTSTGGMFHANLHKGATASPYVPSENEKTLARHAIRALKLTFGGVDIIDSIRGPLVLEVNPSPGFGISDIVGYDVSERLIQILTGYDND